MTEAKRASESRTEMSNIVLPSETNALDNMFGGEILSRMDRACSIAARKHAESHQVVTVSVNHVSFLSPIPNGSIVKMVAKVTRAFSSSMEIMVDVWMVDPEQKTAVKTNEGIYTFVAVDRDNRPVKVPQLIPETDEEKERFAAALRRRQLSLVIAKKMKPSEATELKDLLFGNS